MSATLKFVLAALATWRLAFMLVRERGPGNVLVRLRGDNSTSWRGSLFRCVKCVSFWLAAPSALFVGGNYVEWAFTWWAIAGAAALMDELTRPPFEMREL